ncbi:hypothetical protein TNCV_2977371 [Trichonephila clavipes]|nr:hypothetical protein TNCV_2977371 [Trichonephila clavipes]
MEHIKSWPLSSRGKSPSLDFQTALTGGAHRIQLLSSRGKSRLHLAWHSRMRRALDQSTLPPRVLEGVKSLLQTKEYLIMIQISRIEYFVFSGYSSILAHSENNNKNGTYRSRHSENNSKSGTYLSEGGLGMEATWGRSSLFYDAGFDESGVFHSAEWHDGDWSSDGIQVLLKLNALLGKESLRVHYCQIYHSLIGLNSPRKNTTLPARECNELKTHPHSLLTPVSCKQGRCKSKIASQGPVASNPILNIRHVMEICMKIANLFEEEIQRRMFGAQVEENKSDYGKSLYHAYVRWLSQSIFFYDSGNYYRR